MTVDLVLRGARRFESPELPPVDIAIKGERIAAVATVGEIDLPAGTQVVDVDGTSVLPGLVDAHVHPIHDETGATVGRAGAAGGVTTACLHLYPAKGEPVADAVARMEAEAGQGIADFAHHIRLTPDVIAQGAPGLGDVGAIGVKMFMAHPDKSAQVNLGELARGMKICADLNLPVVVHAEFGELIDALPEVLGVDLANLTLQDLADWRSQEIEGSAIEAAGVVARITGATLYIPHVSGKRALRQAVAQKHMGGTVYVETCPHYLFLTSDTTASLGGLGRVLPPLRGEVDNTALHHGIRTGEVDVVASDHCGHGPAAKRRDDVAGSKAGLPGIEQLGSLLIDEAIRDRRISRADVVRTLATNPARIFGLSRKGALAAGMDADLLLIDEGAERTLSASTSLDASEYSPYEQRVLRGDIKQVWRRGEKVAENGALLVDGGGRLQRRG